MIVFASSLPSSPSPPAECPSAFERASEGLAEVLWSLAGSYCCSRVDTARLKLSRVTARVEIFALRKHRWPTDLQEVFGDEGVPRTPWGHTYVLAPPLVVGGAPVLVDPGRDGVLGMACAGGEDVDLRSEWTSGEGYGVP